MTKEQYAALVLRCNFAIQKGERNFSYEGKTWSTESKYLLACMAENHNLQAQIGTDGALNIKTITR